MIRILFGSIVQRGRRISTLQIIRQFLGIQSRHHTLDTLKENGVPVRIYPRFPRSNVD